MIRRRAAALSGLMVLVAWSGIEAQQPAPATPVPPGPAAAKTKGRSRAEFRVGGLQVNGQRSYDYYNSVKTANGTIKGIEVLLRGGGVGLYVRSLSGDFGSTQPQVISADARVLLFPPVFTVFGGVGKRALSSTLNTRIRDIIMGGVSSTVHIGGTGLRTYISGAMLIAPDKSGGSSPTAAAKNTSTGLEGEAAIYYRFGAAPLFVTVGYRTEVFTGKDGTIQSPEEVRGLRVGGGIQFGGR